MLWYWWFCESGDGDLLKSVTRKLDFQTSFNFDYLLHSPKKKIVSISYSLSELLYAQNW